MRHDMKSTEQKQSEQRVQDIKDLKSAMKIITNYMAYKYENPKNENLRLTDENLQSLWNYIQWCMNNLAQWKKNNL